MTKECVDCGYSDGEHADDCPVATGMTRERYELIRRCNDDPTWAADEILRLRTADEPPARITEMNFKAKEGEPFEASANFQGDAVKEWSIAMVQWFREKGGINYVACDLSDPTTGERFEITMQKAGGRTPAQDLAEMRAQLNALNRPVTTEEKS